MADLGNSAAALLEVARSLRPRILAERDRIETARRLPEDFGRELARQVLRQLASGFDTVALRHDPGPQRASDLKKRSSAMFHVGHRPLVTCHYHTIEL